MRVGVIGVNYKLADLKLREQLAQTCHRHFGPSPFSQVHGPCILLSTCNRTEIYFSSMDLAQTHSYLLNILRSDVEEEFDQKLYSYFGLDCFYHLAKVTTGLDSAILAETEIQGQVKQAYESTALHHPVPKELHFLFQKSLGVAKKIRHDLQLSRGLPYFEKTLFNLGEEIFNDLKQTRILFVGVSTINLKILKFFKTRSFQSITFCNRSDHQAALMADTWGIEHLPWNHLKEWPSFDWVIFGTKAPYYLATCEDLDLHTAESNCKLLIDLSVPRNVDPQINQTFPILLYNIDQINHLLAQRQFMATDSLLEAERRIAQATCHHVKSYNQRTQHQDAFLYTAHVV